MIIDERNQLEFPPWIKRFPGRGSGAAVVFPHAGGAAAAYRPLATALSTRGVDTYVMQYPQRADRLAHPAPDTIDDLADELFAAGDWGRLGPLRLFGHCMGSLVAFEFARIADRRDVQVHQLWASSGQAPSTVAESPPLPTTDRDLLADMVDLGGTDPRLLADEDFVELLLMAVRADYLAFGRYSCNPDVKIRADIHALGGSRDHRVDSEMLSRWKSHTDGQFTLSFYDGGHFYLNDHTDAVADRVSANGH
ncbi:MAG TPA: thioesterase domain-containing protein [Mycobacterium sp.]|nr:thioesterase domain-containing protein [Mycobacterium sp.]